MQYEGYFYLEVPPSAPLINLLMSEYDAINNPLDPWIMSPINCNSDDPTDMCSAPYQSLTATIGASAGQASIYNITSYSRKIEKVNCSDGQGAIPIIDDFPNRITVLQTQALPVIPLNFIPIPFPTGPINYFLNKGGQCYKLTITVYNECGSAEDWTYFEVNGSRQLRLKSPNTSNLSNTTNSTFDLKVYPNPATNEINLSVENDLDQLISTDIMDVSGRHVKQIMNTNLAPEHHFINSSIAELSSGFYFIKVQTKENLKIIKFTKQ